MTENTEKFVDTEIKSYRRQWKCPSCDEGFMNLDKTAPMLMRDPPLFAHVCDKCGYTCNNIEKYPTVVYKYPP